MDEGRPGAITGVVGTLAAAAGAIVVLTDFARSGDGRGILVGGILVVAGLLLRIEGAIVAARAGGEDGEDPPG